MKKKKPAITAHIKVKDPKKVAAGKARAAKAIRVNGKFTENAFLEEITRIAEMQGVKDPYDFYRQNEAIYERMYKMESFTTVRDTGKIKQDIKGYNGKIVKNGKEVKKASAIKSMNALNQYLKIEHSVVAWGEKVGLTMFGKMSLNIPTPAQVEMAMENYDDAGIVDCLQDEFNIWAVVSEGGNGKQGARDKEQAREDRRRYNESEGGKAARKAYKAVYKKTDSGKAEKARYKAKVKTQSQAVKKLPKK